MSYEDQLIENKIDQTCHVKVKFLSWGTIIYVDIEPIFKTLRFSYLNVN